MKTNLLTVSREPHSMAFQRLIEVGPFDNIADHLDIFPESLDAPLTDGRTPLIFAVWRDRLHIVDLLINRGSQALLIADDHGSLPIHFAAQKGSLPIVQRLLDLLPVPEDKSKSEVIREHLLIRGATGKTPFEFSLETMRKDVILFLFEQSPEAIFASTNPFIALSETSSLLLSLLRSAINIFPLERLRPLLLDQDKMALRRILQRGQMKTICEVLKIVPEGLSLFPVDQLAKILAPIITDNNHKAFELIFSHVVAKDISIEAWSQAVAIAVANWNVMAFDALWKIRPGDLKEVLVRKFSPSLNDAEFILLSEALKRPKVEILEQLVPVYLELVREPYYRGHLAAHLSFSRTTLFHQLVGHGDIRLVMIAAQLLEGIFGQNMVHALTQPNAYNNLPVDIAVQHGKMSMCEFLIWLGGEIGRMPSPMNDKDKFKYLFEAIGARTPCSLSEEEQLVVRHRVYFERSLTNRLIYFV